MADEIDSNGNPGSKRADAIMAAPDIDAWFVNEVLPLEATLLQYLHTHARDKGEAADLCQEVFIRIYEAALELRPNPVRPFVFATARNLLLNHLRHARIVPIEAVSDVDALSIAIDEPSPERVVMARDALRRVLDALEQLPPRAREVVVLKQVDGLSRREIAQRLGISEETVKWHLATGISALTDLYYGPSTGLRRKS